MCRMRRAARFQCRECSYLSTVSKKNNRVSGGWGGVTAKARASNTNPDEQVEETQESANARVTSCHDSERCIHQHLDEQ